MKLSFAMKILKFSTIFATGVIGLVPLFHLFLTPGQPVYADNYPVFDNYLSLDYGFDDASLGDINGDGSLDIVGTTGKIYLNDGEGSFLEERTFNDSGNTGNVVLGDMNNDGELDIVTSDGSIYLNNGLGYFSEISIYEGSWDVELGDMDNDSHFDIVTSNGKYSSMTVQDITLLRGISGLMKQ